jgi:hypothetical protein
MQLSRDLRNELTRAAGSYMRANDGAGVIEISDHVFSIMLSEDEDRYGTDPFEAIEISDYAYGIATFITGGKRDW